MGRKDGKRTGQKIWNYEENQGCLRGYFMLLPGQGTSISICWLGFPCVFCKPDRIQVENYRYDYDANIREDEKSAQIYRELAPQTRWRVGRHTQIEPIWMNALKQLSSLGMPTYQGQIYYADTSSVLICGEILPYGIFQLFTDMPEVKKLYVFPYPFREGWEKPLYFSFEPTEAAREEMRKYVEKNWMKCFV